MIIDNLVKERAPEEIEEELVFEVGEWNLVSSIIRWNVSIMCEVGEGK